MCGMDSCGGWSGLRASALHRRKQLLPSHNPMVFGDISRLLNTGLGPPDPQTQGFKPVAEAFSRVFHGTDAFRTVRQTMPRSIEFFAPRRVSLTVRSVNFGE